MRRSWIQSLAVGALFAAAACSDQANQPLSAPDPTSPSFARVRALTCDFKLIGRQANRYFGVGDAMAAKDLITAMQDAGAGSATARDRGFDVMAMIAANVAAGNPRAQDASNLTNSLLICMFSDPADLPATFPEDFTVAADPNQHGAYEVRGGAADPETTPVLSRPWTSPFSGIAPPGGVTWPQMLSGNPAPARLLVYGRPGASGPQVYDWKVAPRSTTFSPPAIVGVCVDAGANPSSLLHEEDVGLLTFVDAWFLDPASCSSVAAAPSWPQSFARGVLRLFAPADLWAGSALNPGGIGGSTGGIGSEFGPQEVSFVTLTFVVQPTDIMVGQTITPAVVIQATAEGSTSTIPNVQITLTAEDNNGVPAELLGTLTQVTGADGTATFADLSQVKTGGYQLVATGFVIGRPGITVPAYRSERFNVRP